MGRTLRRRRLGILAVALGLVLAVGSAEGRLDAGADLLFGSDRAVRDALTAVAPPTTIDARARDGRSPVPARWHNSVARFDASDRLRRSLDGDVVFVGSSSIDAWTDLPAQFPGHRIVQRGLGGATMADCAGLVDRLVLPYRPRVVVVYAGDNDLAAGIAPERIVAEYATLASAVHAALPDTRLVFVSIKPSPSREALLPLVRQTNRLMAAFAGTDLRLDFVDVFSAMLDGDARPRPELFTADGLHMNQGGYALWRDKLVAHLDPPSR